MKTLKLIFLFVALLALSAAMFVVMRSHSRPQALREICSRVYTHHYFGRSALHEWYRDCLGLAALIPAGTTTDEIVVLAKQQLQKIHTSHLDIFSPAEDKLIWKGHLDKDSGMRARGIDGRFVVYKVYPGSAADRAGVRMGDEIVDIENATLIDFNAVILAEGAVLLRRLGADVRVHIQPGELKVDGKPVLERESDGVGLLEISSFRREYFDKSEWLDIASRLREFEHVIVDLRGNLGGDFVAVMRALSPFLCEPTHIGDLVRPQESSETIHVLEDNMTASEIYNLLTGSHKIELRTFPDYPCYLGSVTVLVDQDSASVSEIFAAAIRMRPQSRVWGENTRGDMLLGVWYPLPLLGPGYTISIPEALFQDVHGGVIEGFGVEPDRRLYYRLSDALRGEDSWLLDAVRVTSRL